MPTTPPTPSASTTISRSCGSCRRRRCCRTAAPAAACRSPATSTRVADSLDGIVDTWNENVWLASRGGGIGTYWGNVRGIGEPVGLNGKTSGIIPFVRVMDSLTLAISQGSLRRGSAACYLDISHPEIEEFLEIRKPSGDFNRKALNLHHGVLVTDEFMEAVRDGAEWTLQSPKDGSERATRRRPHAVPEAGRDPPRDRRALHHLHRPGEPGDAQASPRSRPQGHHLEPVLARSRCRPARDHLGSDRTAVCCLSSLNLETWDEWNGDKVFIEDVMRFLDNVLQDYIDRAPDEMARASYSAERERSVGLGVMGFHSFLQARGIPFEGAMAKSWNLKIFKHIRAQVDEASMMLAQRARPLPRRRRHGRDGALQLQDGDRADRVDLDHLRRHLGLHRADPGQHLHPQDAVGLVLDPQPASREAARSRNRRTREGVWDSILEQGGSVQHLDFLTPEEKDVFKTSFEIDQRWLIELAADRTPYIDQAPVAEPVHPGRRRQMGPADAPLPRLGAGHQSRFIICAPRASSAPASPAASRPTTRPTSGRSSCRRPIMTSAWRASEHFGIPAIGRAYRRRRSLRPRPGASASASGSRRRRSG